MCGILGMIVGNEVPDFPVYAGLKILENARNRGDDGAGLFILNKDSISVEKWAGTALDIPKKTKDNLYSHSEKGVLSVLGHARYGTHSTLSKCNTHPITAKKGSTSVSITMNGEISFTERWNREAKAAGIEIEGDNDTANIAGKICTDLIRTSSLVKTLSSLYKNCFPFGGFTILGIAVSGREKFFFYLRDGIRPLFRAKVSDSVFYFSETSHVSGLPAEAIEEVPAGEIGIYSFSSKSLNKTDLSSVLKGIYRKALCPFELAYFQNHSSRLDGHTMNSIRKEFGMQLAEEFPPKNSQTISWVPKSGISATQGYYEKSVEQGIHSEFKQVIMRKKPSEEKGERSFLGSRSNSLSTRLARKFKINRHEAKNADLILIDDSIVRGSVSGWLSKMLKKARAKKVTFLSAWPPMVGGCKAGIDMTEKQLLSERIMGTEKARDNKQLFEHRLTEEFELPEIGRVKFDRAGFISKEGMKKILETHLQGKMCTGCFSHEYNYIHSGNLSSPPKWLEKFIEENGVEAPEEYENAKGKKDEP